MAFLEGDIGEDDSGGSTGSECWGEGKIALGLGQTMKFEIKVRLKQAEILGGSEMLDGTVDGLFYRAEPDEIAVERAERVEAVDIAGGGFALNWLGEGGLFIQLG